MKRHRQWRRRTHQLRCPHHINAAIATATIPKQLRPSPLRAPPQSTASSPQTPHPNKQNLRLAAAPWKKSATRTRARISRINSIAMASLLQYSTNRTTQSAPPLRALQPLRARRSPPKSPPEIALAHRQLNPASPFRISIFEFRFSLICLIPNLPLVIVLPSRKPR